MHVPEHIFIPGDSRNNGGFSSPGKMDGGNAVTVEEMMKVPEKILVAGGDAHLGLEGQPQDVLLNHMSDGINLDSLAEPPSHLTLNHYPEVVRYIDVQLEDENERRKNREYRFVFTMLLAVGGFVGTLIFRKRFN
ncbi:hypothetical protein QR680_007839 [Steinernema hermaphroditum]|uniref:Mitochondrial fission factor n=1 Tax=Steinernema hermaphroditum TaxID=289476 RepID=A0AA39IEG0_9BILA|nr:hypothetical protein QR680_007839 [Steinernema hermaphroditum]